MGYNWDFDFDFPLEVHSKAALGNFFFFLQ